MDKTVLITGVSGFIGRYCARLFSEQGWKVAGVDCVTVPPPIPRNLFRYYQLVLPAHNFPDVVSDMQPTVCVHCAGPASVGNSMENPAADFNGSVAVTFNVLDSLRLGAPKCRFIYPSSAAVYGNPEQLPVGEKHHVDPISSYGFHKLICEQLSREFKKVYNLPTVVVRIFSAYGNGLKRQVLWDICRKAVSEKKLLLQGSGLESRDFIHVSDVARAIHLLVEKAPFEGEVYNLASGIETTIRDLQEMLTNELGSRIQVEYDGLTAPGNPLYWRADISLISGMGYRPVVSLAEGVRSYARWYLGGSQADE